MVFVHSRSQSLLHVREARPSSWSSGLSSEHRRVSCSPFENPEFARGKKAPQKDQLMSTRAAALQPGPFMARSRANEARSPASPPALHHSLPPTSSYMTSSLGRAEAPQAVLLPICSCSSCLSCYLGLHYKEVLYGALKGSSHSLLFLLLASRFVKADSCIQCVFYPELFVCMCALSSLSFFVCLCISLEAAAARYLRIRIFSASF